MSKYTTELRWICESLAGRTEQGEYSDITEIIETASPLLFNFDYPIFDENYREALQEKIIMHYYTREISEETVGLWKLRLRAKMNEIMPYYNQFYKSTLFKFNPLWDTDVTTEKTGTSQVENNATKSGNSNAEINIDRVNSGTKENTGNEAIDSTSHNTSASENENNTTRKQTTNDINNSDSMDAYSDTPQGTLSNVENEVYLTNARKIRDSSSNTNDTQGSENSKYSDSTVSENSGKSLRENTSTESTSGSAHDSHSHANTYSDTSTGNINSTDAYVLHVAGKQSGTSFSKLLTEFRNTFLNIDLMVIEALAPLFFNLW